MPPPTPPAAPKFALGDTVAAMIEAEVVGLSTPPAQPPLYVVAAALNDGTLGEMLVQEFQLSRLNGGATP